MSRSYDTYRAYRRNEARRRRYLWRELLRRWIDRVGNYVVVLPKE